MDDSSSCFNMTSDLSSQSLLSIIKSQENEYIATNKTNHEWNTKYYKLKQLKMDLFSKKAISQEDFFLLREHALSKGGFLTNEIRKDFWRIILCVEKENDNKTNHYQSVYINEGVNVNSDDVFLFKQEPYDIKIKNDYGNIIEVDVKRSKLNLLFQKEGGYHDTNLSLKKNLKLFINTLATLNNQNYNYYQGYHDIALHFILLYINDFHIGVSVFQRFSEFFLKENLMRENKDNFDTGYNFERINCILSDIVRLISPEAMSYIDQFCYGRPSFVISWLLTLFTHNVMNSAVQFRLFDYFITSHPMTIYYLTAVILIEEIGKLSKGKHDLV